MGYTDPGRSDLAVISKGISGLTEISFELEPGRRGNGAGAGLVRDALGTIRGGEIAVAAVAPGNTASVRALLTAGFMPAGSVQLFSGDKRDARQARLTYHAVTGGGHNPAAAIEHLEARLRA